MRFNKAEVFFIAMLVFLSGVGVTLLWLRYAAFELASSGSIQNEVSFDAVNRLIIVAGLFLALAVISAVMVMVPQIQMQVKKDGYLKIITWTIAKRSQDLASVNFTDPLTGLQNRRYFDEALREYLLQFGKIGKSVSVLLIVVDDFSRLCDAHGRVASDALLYQAAQVMRNCTRYHDVLARFESDEFALIAPNINAEDAQKLALRICEVIGELNIGEHQDVISLSASAGIAVWDGAENSAALYARADEKLMQASLQGNQNICM